MFEKFGNVDCLVCSFYILERQFSDLTIFLTIKISSDIHAKIEKRQNL